ncbi:MAG: FtsX-like permease family protein [Sulfuriferula sp.]|nr:FtsX-like permease family protein [Sulfuriferula sp.]
MNPIAMLAESWRAIIANRMRSFLTMLGMIIGVAAVVLMLAVGQGAQSAIDETISAMGSNLFIVLSGATTSGGQRMGLGTAPTLKMADAAAIADLPNIEAAAPVQPGTATTVYAGNNWSTSITGVTPDYLRVRNWSMATGFAFTDADVRGAARVALLGKTVVDNLFGDENPIGKTIRIKQSPFTVVGVLESKGQSLDGRDQDDVVIVPVTTAQRKLFGSQFPGSVKFIMVQATSAEAMPAVEKEMNVLLRARHRIADDADADFTVRNLSAMAEASASATRIMSYVLGAIASISLIVGGIGIMNIMLVSVTERTREIGIRIAIGARHRDILLQFLLEAITISLIGCLIGVGLGVGGAWAVQKLAGFPVLVTPDIVLLAFSVAAGVGIFFGFYPARRAALMNPIDALRYQ